MSATTGKRPTGRPPIGVTKKISVTLPAEIWKELDEERNLDGESMSKFIRSVIMVYYKGVNPKTYAKSRQGRQSRAKPLPLTSESNYQS